jgi:uncharacterized integral membrane protein
MTDPTAAQGDDHGAARVRHRGRDVRMVVTGVVTVLLVWFAVANLQGVKIRFWLASTKAPLIVVIVVAGVLGAAVSGLVTRTTRRRRKGDDEAA